MLNTQELLLALLTAHLNNARIYEYLLGALLQEPQALRTRVERDMLKHWQKSTTYLDTSPRNIEPSKQPEVIANLRVELDLNKQLIQTLRNCQTDLNVKHGTGSLVIRCTSKWAFQDFPELLDRIVSPYQTLTVLCKHVIDKYDCYQDPVITSVRQNIGITNKRLSSRQEYKLSVSETAPNKKLIAKGQHFQNLNVSSKLGKSPGLDEASIDVNNNDKDKALVSELRARLRECLDQMKAAPQFKNGDSKHHIRLNTMDVRSDTNSRSDNAPYWMPNLYKNASPLPTDNGTDNVSQTLPDVGKMISMKMRVHQSTAHITDDTACSPVNSVPINSGFEPSTCAIRCSRMAPLKAPVRKAKLANPLPHYDTVSDDANVLGPYVKPLFRKRVSLVPDTKTDEAKEKWDKFYTHLQIVRLRVIKRINTQFSPSSRLFKKKKQKKHTRKRKSKKLAKSAAAVENDASHPNQPQNLHTSGYPVQNNDVTSGKTTSAMECAN